MRPLFVASPPKTAASPPSDPPAGTRQGRAHVHFGSVGNLAESPRAERAHSPKPHRAHGLFNAVRAAFSHIGGGKAHAAQPQETKGVKLDQPAKFDQLLKPDLKAEQARVENVFENVGRIHQRLTPLLFQDDPSLTPEQVTDVSMDVGRLGQGLRALTQKIVLGEDGQPRRLLELSDATAARITDLTASSVVGDHTVDVLFGNAHRREVALGKHDLGVAMLRQFLADTRRVLFDVAREIGDTELGKQADVWFRDPMFKQLLQTQGTSQRPGPGYDKIARKTPMPNPDWGGARYKDTPLRQDTAVQLSNDRHYYAPAITTRTGVPLGTATAYPRSSDMPDYLRMLQETGLDHVLVLASRKEIEGSKGSLPPYFSESRAWGDYSVEVDPHVHTQKIGDLTLAAHTLTITDPRGNTRQVTAHHVENWPDRQTVREETLIALALEMWERVGDFGKLGVHCKAGLGRTGTFQAIAGLVQDPSLLPGDILEDGRGIRGPGWVQVNDQLETVVAGKRLLQAYGHRAQPRQAAAPDWPRQSLVDADAPPDDEPVYANVTPRPPGRTHADPADVPPPLPPKRGTQPPGAHGVDGRPTPAPRPQPRGNVPR